MRKWTTAVLGSSLMFVGMLGATAPTGAAVPAKKTTGKVVVDASYNCSVKLKGNGITRKVPNSGVVKGLTPGTYKVVAKPSKCKPKKAKVKVKKGKTVKTKVLYDPKQVPTSMSGTFSGEEFVNGRSYARWNANVTLQLEEPIGGYTGAFETLARYRVTALTGNWTINYQPSSECTYEGNGTLGIDDLRIDSTGRPDPWWTNPWNDFTYAFEAVAKGEKSWAYTRTCTDPYSQRQEPRPLPFRLLSTNQWSGIEPVAPLNTGSSPSGSYTWDLGTSRYTWTWDIGVDLGKEMSKP